MLSKGDNMMKRYILFTVMLLLVTVPSLVRAAGNSIVTATPLPLNTTTSDILPSGQQEHYFRFVLASAGNVSLSLSPSTINASMNGYLLDESGTREYLHLADVSFVQAQGKEVALPAGTYLVRVVRGSNGSDIGYKIKVSFTSGDGYEKEFNDTPATANSMSPGIKYAGGLQKRSTGNDPADYYRFELPTAGSVSLAFQHTQLQGTWQVQLLDESANREFLNIPVSVSGLSTNLKKEVALPAGTYLVKVASGTQFVDERYEITLTVTAGDAYEKEFNDEAATATVIDLGKKYSGNIQRRSDGAEPADFYRFVLPTAGNALLNVKYTPNQNASSPWYLSVLDESGAREYLSMPVPVYPGDVTQAVGLPAGTYLVKVTKGDSFSDARYDLTVSLAAGEIYEKEFNDTVATANPIQFSTAYSARLQNRHEADVDHYRATLVVPGTVAVNFKHAASDDDTVSWSVKVVEIVNDAEVIRLEFISGASDTDLVRPVTLPAGTYVVRVAAGAPSAIGLDYQVSVLTPKIATAPNGLLDFGSVGVKNTVQKTLSITNNSAVQLAVAGVGLAGPDADQFRLGNGCTTIAPGGICGVSVTFVPSSTGKKEAALLIDSTDQTNPHLSVSLEGTGVQHAVTVAFSGTGDGSVMVNPGNRACGIDCAGSFDWGTLVTLRATPDQYSQFTGWSGGGCSGTGTCAFSISGDTVVTAAFTRDTTHAVRINRAQCAYYPTLTAALGAAASGETIEAWGVDFAENLLLDRTAEVALKGGYNGTYTGNGGMTTLNGSLVVGKGALLLEGLTIR